MESNNYQPRLVSNNITRNIDDVCILFKESSKYELKMETFTLARWQSLESRHLDLKLHIKFIAFSYFFAERYLLWTVLQTLLKTKSFRSIFGILKAIVCKTNSKHGFYSPLLLLVLLIVHSALQTNLSNYVHCVDVLIPKKMLISIKSFFVSQNSKICALGLRFL